MNQEMQNLVEKGYSLVPVNEKVPLCSFSKEVPLQKTHYLIERYHGKVAIHTGRSGVTVVDMDSKEAQAEAQKLFPPSPMRAATDRGEHWYYQGITEKRLRYRGLALDIISGNNLITVREWLTPILSPEDLPLFPKLDEVKLPSIPLVSRETSSVRKYIARIFAVSGAGGHSQTFRAACKLADAGLSEQEIFQELLLWNLTNADPAWDEPALLHKARSAFNRRKP